MLWVGWFGFNAGSAVAADVRAGMAMAATQIATAAAALAWMFAEWLVQGQAVGARHRHPARSPAWSRSRRPRASSLPSGALVIGIAAGVALLLRQHDRLKNALGYDDSLDAFGVHAIGGIIGALLTGVFATMRGERRRADPVGWIDGNAGQVGSRRSRASPSRSSIDAIVSARHPQAIDMTLGLRVSEDIEREGLDLGLHGEVVPCQRGKHYDMN